MVFRGIKKMSDELEMSDVFRCGLVEHVVKREIYSGDIEEIKGVIRGYQRRTDGCIAEFAPALK